MSAGLVDSGSDPARRKALRYFNVFRLIIAGAFVVAGAQFGLGFESPRLFRAAALAYVLLVLALGFPDIEGRIGFGRLMTLQSFVDVMILSIALWTSAGYHSGILVLMMIVLAGFGLVAEGRIVLLMASLATISVLTENVWRTYAGGRTEAGDFFQVALTCISFFGIAIVARMLAQRAHANASLAAVRGEALARQEAINAQIIRDMRDGVIVVRADGVVRHANPSASALLGCVHVEGRALAEIDPTLAEFCQTDSGEFGQMVTLGRARRLLRCRVAGGSGGIGAEGDQLIYLTDLEDIERRMQQLKLASLGRLTASMAHEIRNPLSAVTQAAELLREEKRGDMQARLARIINDNAKRIERMIRDVLALGRRERTQPEALPLAEFIVELFEAQGLGDEAERAIFTAAIDPALTLGIDRAHLHQILDNLLVNARRYCSGQPGAVRVEAEDAGEGRVRLHVMDDGPGVGMEARAHLFEPFFTSHAKGTGLGLYIARELAEANGINLDLCEDDPARPGAHFILTGRNLP